MKKYETKEKKHEILNKEIRNRNEEREIRKQFIESY